MICECDRSVPGTWRSADEWDASEERDVRAEDDLRSGFEPESSICSRATPARVDSAAVSSDALRSEVGASA